MSTSSPSLTRTIYLESPSYLPTNKPCPTCSYYNKESEYDNIVPIGKRCHQCLGLKGGEYTSTDPHSGVASFESWVGHVFGLGRDTRSLYAYSILVLMKNHLYFDLTRCSAINNQEGGEGDSSFSEEPDGPSSFSSGMGAVFPKRFHAAAKDITLALGFSNHVCERSDLRLDAFHQLMKKLSTCRIPGEYRPSGEYFCRMASRMNTQLEIEEIRRYWRSEQEDCTLPSKKATLAKLANIWKKVKREEMVREGGMSEMEARLEISRMDWKHVLNGAMWLAIDVWSMEVSIATPPGSCEKIIESLSSGEHKLPSCVSVVEYDVKGGGKALAYVPSACAYEDWTYFTTPDCCCNRNRVGGSGGSKAFCPDRYGTCRKFRMESQLSHHYCQEKLCKLTRERRMSTECAKKLVAWTTFPVNAVMPMGLMLCILRKSAFATSV